MAVYKRAYRPYEGPLTSERWRFLVLPRYAFREVFESKLLVAFLALCLVPFLAEAAVIYVASSAPARALLHLPEVKDLVNASFFLRALSVQGVLAFFLVSLVAPVLVSPDLTNGALPLYLSRPLTRADYVLGKAVVLVALLSLITWLPGLVLFNLQAGLAGRAWLLEHLHVAWAILAGSWIWIAVLTLLGLAISAWIRWRLVASAGLMGLFFMGSAFGEAWREMLQNSWGRLTNLYYLIGLVWIDLFGPVSRHTVAREILDDRLGRDLPVWAAWLGLLAVCGLCLYLLNRRLRAREVVS